MKPAKGRESEDEYIKRRRKELSATQTLDEMKTSLEESLKSSPWNSKFNESLQRVTHSASTGLKSYQEIFEEIGGSPREAGQVDMYTIERNKDKKTAYINLSDTITQVVQTDKIMPHEDLKEKIYEDWDKIIRVKSPSK